METMIENSVNYTYNAEKLIEKINKSIDQIGTIIEDNDYQVKNDLNLYKNQSVISFGYLSKNQMKTIQKYCYWIEKRPTLRRINTFLGKLSKCLGWKELPLKFH